jgi:hypothetical protein
MIKTLVSINYLLKDESCSKKDSLEMMLLKIPKESTPSHKALLKLILILSFKMYFIAFYRAFTDLILSILFRIKSFTMSHVININK